MSFRKFRNSDPPLLTGLWNQLFTGRGAISLPTSTPLERLVLAKPYFDPEGLILAEEAGQCLGFGHAGFAGGAPGTQGVVCLIGVRPDLRRRGIGSELLRQCENYLRQRGAEVILAGGSDQGNPFYFGLYGGSDCLGFLQSDGAVQPFFSSNGYTLDRQFLVWQRDLTRQPRMNDPRFAAIRAAYDIRVRSPKDVGGFSTECRLGQMDPVEFLLQARQGDAVAAHTYAWEMEGYSSRWGKPAVGLVCFHVVPELRRRGLGKFFLGSLLRQLQDQYLQIVEVQTEQHNQPAHAFLKNLGFSQVDAAHVYVRAA